jgi:hypothetical protein
LRPAKVLIKVIEVKTKKTITRAGAAPRVRRGTTSVDEASFTVVLEDLRAQFRVFGEALQELPTRRQMYAMGDGLREEMHTIRDELRGEMHAIRDELRGEMHAMRDELRGDIAFLRTAVLDLSKRIP